MKTPLQLVHSNCFYQKNILHFYIQRVRNIEKIDELEINGPILERVKGVAKNLIFSL